MRDSDWEILYDLYKTPNLTKVANMRYMTQPSITKRIQNIENEFDVKILNRTSKGLSFTPEGCLLAKKAEEHIDFIRKAHEEVEDLKAQVHTNLELGASYTYSKYVLTDILAQYSKNHPDVTFDILSASSEVLFRKMLEGSMDAVFVCGDYDGPIHKVLVDRQYAYAITREPIASTDELLDMSYLAYNTNDKTRELMNGWWNEKYGKVPRPEMTVGLMDFVWTLIRQHGGYTYSFLPDSFRNEQNLILTPLIKEDGTPLTRNTWFVYSTAKRQSRQMEEFIKYIYEAMKYRK